MIVALFADPGAYVARYAEADKAGGTAAGLGRGRRRVAVPYWFVDVGFAAMALLLGAVDAGLGACFLGSFRGEAALSGHIGRATGAALRRCRARGRARWRGSPVGFAVEAAGPARTRPPRPVVTGAPAADRCRRARRQRGAGDQVVEVGPWA